MTHHSTHHALFGGNLFGVGLAIWGAITADHIRENAGVLIAVLSAAVSMGVWIYQVLYASQLRRDAAKEKHRREQELLEAEHRAKMAEIDRRCEGCR